MFDFETTRNEVAKWAKNRERKFLEDFCKEAGIKEPIGYKYRYHEGFTIYTNRPGIMIGKAGNLVNKYTKRLQEEFCKDDKIFFVEIDNFANY